ncbi:MAG TPA: HIT family protein [Longimicrobium sp.]|jgi:diadenosine tetraphosphate (Ap4A) HIT family hydrolase|uniref:HIT family protein n=1 Tax=Longimicrobium sp. TaxID=2029185 RepID=UPI002EDAD454
MTLENEPTEPIIPERVFVSGCPFCELSADDLVDQNQHAVAIPDRYPLSPGHILVIPRRHVVSPFDLHPDELASVWSLVAQIRRSLAAEFVPDAFTIGLNDGAAAGQTIMHAHVHVIPRWTGDVADPRGGVRWVIPAQAPYWDVPTE